MLDITDPKRLNGSVSESFVQITVKKINQEDLLQWHCIRHYGRAFWCILYYIFVFLYFLIFKNIILTICKCRYIMFCLKWCKVIYTFNVQKKLCSFTETFLQCLPLEISRHCDLSVDQGLHDSADHLIERARHVFLKFPLKTSLHLIPAEHKREKQYCWMATHFEEWV